MLQGRHAAVNHLDWALKVDLIGKSVLKKGRTKGSKLLFPLTALQLLHLNAYDTILILQGKQIAAKHLNLPS